MGVPDEHRFRVVDTGWGWFGFDARGEALRATFLPAPERAVRRTIREQFPEAREDGRLLPRFVAQVRDYFARGANQFDVAIDLADRPPFHREVYAKCRRIRAGRTASYRDLARAAGSPNAMRAVGNAMAKNPLPLVVPCHRVLRADGSLGGFSSPDGVAQKERMLRHEGTVLPHPTHM